MSSEGTPSVLALMAVFVAGLQLSVKDEEKCQSFEYEWASIQQTPQLFDWTPVIYSMPSAST